MGSLWTREFTGGLDTRRLPETTSGGVLLQATNGHINRGGEFEKRAAFVKYGTLPAGTFGLAATASAIYVFGSGVDPGVESLPGFVYQRLVSGNGYPATAVLGADSFSGNLFVAAQASDGSVFNYYGGALVTDFVDGHATATSAIASGDNTAATAASAYFTITGGTTGNFNYLAINGLQITSGNPISITAAGPGSATNNMATSIAADINAQTTNPGYTAAVTADSTVTITAKNPGAATNGYALTAGFSGNITYSGSAAMSGGADAARATYGVQFGGISLTGGVLPFTVNNDVTCQNLAAAINARTSSTGFRATAPGGSQLQVICAGAGADLNGQSIYFNGYNGGTWTSSNVVLAGGRDQGTQPGSYVLTLGSKVYVASGPDLLFSGVDTPYSFGLETTGAGFIDMSAQASGSEQIYALARYQKYMAIFSARQTQIWYMDPDPTANQQLQILYNTGTYAPHSVVAFGDNDVFYLDESGVRSLRSRDASLSATTDDVGVPIDTLIIAKLRTLTLDQRKLVRAVVEPTEGRVWISIIDTIYVFSYFAGAKVSAWSTYVPGINIDEMVAHDSRVYVRSGDNIFVYGGTGTDLVYDATVATAQIPYQDAGKPTITKTWDSLDVAVRGTWDVLVATDPNNPVQQEAVMTATQTTYNAPDSTMAQRSTHCSVIARTRGTGPATLSAIVLGFEDGSGTRPDGGAP